MGETKKSKKSRWKIAAGIILILQCLISAAAIGVLIWLDLLPTVYVVLAGLVLFWLLTICYVCFYAGIRRKKKKKKGITYVRRGIGCLLSVSVMALCVVISFMLYQAENTLQTIAANTVSTDSVAAYVLKEDSAQTLEDAKEYVFAITEKYDYQHTEEALQEMCDSLGRTPKTQTYDSVLDMVAALYGGNVDAMILNEAYVELIEAQDGYESFSEKTRKLYDRQIETIVAASPETEEKDITKDPFIVYISGSDTRHLTLSTSRSDVNILVVVNPSTRQVLLLNTPRDYYVDTAACAGAKDKLTHCGIYGIDCSMATLGSLYDETVDYYAQINFSGFETMVDAIGGITVDSDRAFRCSEGGYYISKGINQLNGATALSYVRERHAFADGDNTRGRHQMQVIEAIIQKASSGTTILSNYSAILDSMEGMFTTSMSSSDISALVKMQLSQGGSWNVKTFAVSGTGGSQRTYSMPGARSYVTYPDERQVSYAKLLVDKVVDGRTLTDADLEMPQIETE